MLSVFKTMYNPFINYNNNKNKGNSVKHETNSKSIIFTNIKLNNNKKHNNNCRII